MGQVEEIGQGKRLKGLDEFAPREFVGRPSAKLRTGMARIERWRKLAWYAMLAGGADFKAPAMRAHCWNVRGGAVALAAGIGLVLF